ncbi:N-acetyl-gamma-glutamyl-phosphate reductase [Micrococcales bacterium 31B]|nr:N-acetyl-gamma-glutamyl-phosphate reductase [Micrococcales bacterium 31B]
MSEILADAPSGQAHESSVTAVKQGSPAETLSVAIAGASGYAGGEIARLLIGHPRFEVKTVTAHSNAGDAFSLHHPHLIPLAHLVLEPTTAETLSGHDIVFFALPHGASGALAATLASEAETHGTPLPLLIDCGADHRLTSATDWADYYGDGYAGSWAYGMPELVAAGTTTGKQRDRLAGERRIAVPGCNVTAVSLALAPLATLIDTEDLTATLAVGVSGAGKSLKTHLLASEMLGSAAPYAVGGSHRHIPEIAQNLQVAGAGTVKLSFTPVLVPMSRGILATCTARLQPGVTEVDIAAAYAAAYDSEPFVTVLPTGQWPTTNQVLGSNSVVLQFAYDSRAGKLVVISAVDNLGKGTAGAAIQSANLAVGLPEATGLPIQGVAP